jgi:thiol-disulfide isomerase/thioredoxin
MLAAQLATLLLTVSAAGGDIVLLDFRADYCGPCRAMDPVVQQLAASGYPVRQVNIEQQRDLAAKFRVDQIPCFVLLVNGREAGRTVGATDGGTLVQMFRKAGYDPSARSAAAAADRGQGGAAAGKEFPAEVSQAPLATATFISPVGSDGTPRPGMSSDHAISAPAAWIASCVRLKVADLKGNSVGSGTIIDARKGEALILTCGHIFRDSDGKGQITVDLFAPGVPQRVAGRLIGCDLDRDVALVGIAVKGSIRAAQVAPQSYGAHKGDRVIGIGCSNGADPTVQESHVNSLSIDTARGAPNIHVAGQPVQGRSGGGLFNSEGQVIGVCNGAEPTDNEGYFAATASIYKELDRAGLSFVYRDSAPASMTLTSARDLDPGTRDADTTAADMPSMPAKMPTTLVAPSNLASKGKLTAEESAALDELREKARAAEVICIVRPLSDPNAKSEIIVLDKASRAFLDQLGAEQRAQPLRQLTSLEVPADHSTNRTSDLQSALVPATAERLAPAWQPAAGR